MLIATQATSVAGTQKYFEQVLTRGDYYLGQEVGGQWYGKGAELHGLGKGSDVTKEQFSPAPEPVCCRAPKPACCGGRSRLFGGGRMLGGGRMFGGGGLRSRVASACISQAISDN